MTSEWAPLAAGAAMLLLGAGMWAWAQVLLSRAEAERRRFAEDRLAALREIELTLDRWVRRQGEGTGC